MKKFTTDGYLVTRGEGYMGIYSTVDFLNDRMSDITKLKRQGEMLRDELKDYKRVHGDWLGQEVDDE